MDREAGVRMAEDAAVKGKEGEQVGENQGSVNL